MNDILNISSGQVIMVIITSIVPILISLLASKSVKKQEKLSKELIEKTVREGNQAAIKTFGDAVSDIPEDQNTEEYLNRLSTTLSTDRYGLFKGESDNTIDKLIQNHHEQALTQASIQFWFSLFAAVVGFIFILNTISSSSSDASLYQTIIKVLPGIVIEAVSALFFAQSKETRERSADYLNKLREDQKISKILSIIDSIDDEKVKSVVKANVALHFSGITDLSNLYGIINDNKNQMS